MFAVSGVCALAAVLALTSVNEVREMRVTEARADLQPADSEE